MNTRDMYMHGASKTKSRSRSGIRPGPATAVVAVLAIAALLTGGLATAYGAPASPKRSQPLNTAAATRAASHPQVTFVVSVRALDNAFSAEFATGADAIAKYLGYSTANVKVLQSGNNDANQVSQLDSLLASTPGAVCIVVDPNTTAITQTIVQAVQRDPNAYVSVYGSKPNNLWPWNGYSHWASFILNDGVVQAEQTAKVLFQKMGGSGGVLVLQGILDNVAAQQRYQGFQAALKTAPGVKMLAQETANWDETTAFNVTKSLLVKYGKNVKGVFAANDEMSLGARTALNDAGMKGVPVVSAADAIPLVLGSINSGGGIDATTNSDGYFLGSVGLAQAYYAAIGKINLSSLPHADRSYYAQAPLVTKANVAQYLKPPVASTYYKYWTLKGSTAARFLLPFKP
jgi:ribose transport system substrate-binding protein